MATTSIPPVVATEAGYLNYAGTEQRLFDQAVTCYERERLFERG